MFQNISHELGVHWEQLINNPDLFTDVTFDHKYISQINAKVECKVEITMRLNLTALCLLLLNLQCRVLADDTKNDAVEKPKHTTNTKTIAPNVEHETSNHGNSNLPANDDDENSGDENSGDENGGNVGNDDTKMAESPVATSMNDGNTATTSTKSIDPKKLGTKPEQNVPKQSVETALETSESLEENNHDSGTKSYNDSTHAFIETSKDVTAQLYNAISGIATTTNITMDAWKNQTWANKTPREVVDMIENEINVMFHDKYVHFIIITMGLLSILFTLYVVQQIIEHPKGILSKFCRCTIACLRIICCPLYTILCCPCCTTKKNRPNTKEYSHLPLHENDTTKKN